jgi:hypothetical protein
VSAAAINALAVHQPLGGLVGLFLLLVVYPVSAAAINALAVHQPLGGLVGLFLLCRSPDEWLFLCSHLHHHPETAHVRAR